MPGVLSSLESRVSAQICPSQMSFRLPCWLPVVLEELTAAKTTKITMTQAVASKISRSFEHEMGLPDKIKSASFVYESRMKSLEGRPQKRHSAAGGTGKKHFDSPELDPDSNSKKLSCVHS